MKKLLSFLIILLLIGIGSCKKEDKEPDYCTSSTWTMQLADELNAMVAASLTYSSNPTTATCTAYKASIQDYLDALKPFEKCSLWTAEQKEDFQQAIDEAEAELDSACQ